MADAKPKRKRTKTINLDAPQKHPEKLKRNVNVPEISTNENNEPREQFPVSPLESHERFRYLRTIHQCDVSFKDRQFIRWYIKQYNIDDSGMCWCYRAYVEKQVENPGSPYVGLKYYGCKYGKRGCAFFRWIDFSKYKSIRTDIDK